uniref:Kinesin motor domain-containing protein n=2 Tax=Lutzomyia longipalpis TaxID=7200 RepID=A0A1B0CKY2_LUTLO
MDNENCAVRIAVRERPFNIYELRSENVESAVEVHPSNKNIIIVDDRPFVFDHVFSPNVTQERVYTELVAPLIDKMLCGFHCTVLAYGQSGNGKTYTMGLHKNLVSDTNSGLISRSISAICTRVQELCGAAEEQENLPELSVSFIEIYNEKVYDLLSENSTEPVNLKMYKYQGCRREKISNSEDAFEVLKQGNKNRHVRPTKINANSSRSHAIFTIYISVRKSKTCTVNSAFNFVDLAGSEGIRRTEHKGVALAEGVNINQGLLSMGHILQAISAGDKLIPYRDSVLTLSSKINSLEDSLNKNCYLTLLACISPSKVDSSETLNTLRFANSAKSMKNNPQINLIITEIQNARRNTPTKPPVTPKKRQTITATLKETTNKKFLPKTPYHNKTFTTPGWKNGRISGASGKKRSSTKAPPAAMNFNVTPFARKTRRSSVESTLSTVSSSTEKPEEVIQAPGRPLIEPSLTTVAFSPIIRRHVEQLEVRLGERMQCILSTINAPTETPRVQPRTDIVSSTPNVSHNQEFPSCPLDEIKRELQKIVRSEISDILGKTLSRRNSVAEQDEELDVPAEDDIQNMTFDVVIPDNPTTDFPVQKDMFEGHAEKENLPEKAATKRRSRRQEIVDVQNESLLRRSARITARRNTTCAEETFKKPPTPVKKRRKQERDVIGEVLKATEVAKGGKRMVKSVHKQEILKLLNTGNLKQLQCLSQVGLKTAFHIITHR